MKVSKFLNYFIALVWILNGLIAKVLGFAPRHQEIVEKILGAEHAFIIIKLIGVLEILLAIWIISRIKPKLCAVTQITLIIAMNIIENIFAKELLMWGGMNIIFALLFCILVYLNGFRSNRINAK